MIFKIYFYDMFLKSRTVKISFMLRTYVHEIKTVILEAFTKFLCMLNLITALYAKYAKPKSGFVY